MGTLDQHQDNATVGFGFGEYAIVRYRGQVFTCGITGNLDTVGFNRNKGSKGIKVYFDTVDGSNLPAHAVGSELYSFVITNANVVNGYGEYTLPTPLPVTSGTKYCFYLAPWDTAYVDDYADCNGINSISGGVAEITSTAGSWATEELTFNYKTYVTQSSTVSVNDTSAVTEGTTVSIQGGNKQVNVNDTSTATDGISMFKSAGAGATLTITGTGLNLTSAHEYRLKIKLRSNLAQSVSVAMQTSGGSDNGFSKYYTLTADEWLTVSTKFTASSTDANSKIVISPAVSVQNFYIDGAELYNLTDITTAYRVMRIQGFLQSGYFSQKLYLREVTANE